MLIKMELKTHIQIKFGDLDLSNSLSGACGILNKMSSFEEDRIKLENRKKNHFKTLELPLCASKENPLKAFS